MEHERQNAIGLCFNIRADETCLEKANNVRFTAVLRTESRRVFLFFAVSLSRNSGVAKLSQQNPPICYSQLAKSRFGGPAVKIPFRVVKHTFSGMVTLVEFAFQVLNITLFGSF